MNPGQTIGVIGLGLVGRALAERFRLAGFDVLGYDVSPEAMRAFDGKTGVDAKKCRRIVLAVYDTPDVEQVAAEVKTEILVNCVTCDPARMEVLAARLKREGVRYVEAPLSGSSDAIRRGEATMFVGGDPAGCEDLLAAITAHRHVVGEVGMALRAKLAINLVLGLNRVALAEGMVFAESLGIPRARFLELVRGSPVASSAALAKGEKMVSGDYAPDSRIRQHLKDVQRIREYAQFALPLTEVHEKLLAAAVAAGDGELDNAAIIRRWRTS